MSFLLAFLRIPVSAKGWWFQEVVATSAPTPEMTVLRLKRRGRAPVPVLREGRVVRHSSAETEPAELPIRKVEMNLFTQPTLGADAMPVADDQHPDHQLGIDRWPPCVAVEWTQLFAQLGQIDEPVDPPQQMIGGNMPLEAEL